MSIERLDGNCPFCQIILRKHYRAEHGVHVVSFIPLDPVTPGHTLFVPRQHIRDAAEGPEWAAQTVKAAAEMARAWSTEANIITSIGPAATQTIWHLHVHLVPRQDGDGLHLPWTGQHKEEAHA